MPRYRALHEFTMDARRVRPGDEFELSANRGQRLTNRGLVAPVRRQRVERAVRTPPEKAVEHPQAALKHVGGGWYELPSGDRVQGREAAEKALRG